MVRSPTKPKRSHTLINGRTSASLASMRKTLTRSASKLVLSRVTRSSSLAWLVRAAASMYLKWTSGSVEVLMKWDR